MTLTDILLAIILGSGISCAGSLPPGNLNVIAAGLGARQQQRAALLFAAGVSVVEVVYLRLTFFLLKDLTGNTTFLYYSKLATIVVLLALAIITIKQRNQQEHSTKQPPKAGATFASGMLLSLLNPLQVVFWLAWIAGLSGAGLICRNEIWYHLFSLASGIGAFAALWVYSLAGARLSAFFTIHKQRMHIIVGLFFFSLAVLEITTLLR